MHDSSLAMLCSHQTPPMQHKIDRLVACCDDEGAYGWLAYSAGPGWSFSIPSRYKAQL